MTSIVLDNGVKLFIIGNKNTALVLRNPDDQQIEILLEIEKTITEETKYPELLDDYNSRTQS